MEKKNNTIIVVPDVHGRTAWKNVIPYANKEGYEIIFLGDYHDPYPYEIIKETSRNRLRDQLLPFVLEHQDKVVCLFGNHDGNYLVGTMADRLDFYHKEEVAEYMNNMNIKLILL